MEGSESGDHFMYVTGSIYVKYLRPTPLDEPVTLRASVTEIKDNKIIVNCTLHSNDALCATGEVMTVKVDTRKFVGQYL